MDLGLGRGGTLRHFRFNIPITKVDEDKRLVYGLVTEEVVDQSGEILDYEGSKKYFQEWSDGIAKATGGASLGNLRLMHQPIIAGKLIELNFDDVLKQISCVARIVSDDVWKLVLEGCLTGFSMGGKYIKRWKDAVDKAVTRFIARPVEVSVVDNPCVQTATFEYIKADGSIELRKFHAGDGDTGDETMLTPEQIRERAEKLAKDAGTPDAVDQFLAEAQTLLEGELEMAGKAAEVEITDPPAAETPAAETPADPPEESEVQRAAADAREAARLTAAEQLVQVWQAPDGTTHAKKAEGIDHILGAPAETAVEKALREAHEGGEPAPEPAAELEDVHRAAEAAHGLLVAAGEHIAPLAKGLYGVMELASALQNLQYITSSAAYEAASEGDSSPVPAQLLSSLRSLGATLVTMAEEEVAEMISDLGSNHVAILSPLVAEIVELAAIGDVEKGDSPVMQKAGARNSKRDATKIQTMHDHAVDLGATCSAEKTVVTEPSELTDEMILELPVVKTIVAERDGLAEEVTKAVSGIADLGTELATLRTDLEKLKKTPQPLPPRTDAVVLRRNGQDQTITQETLEKMSDEDKADLAIRLSQMNPTNVGGR